MKRIFSFACGLLCLFSTSLLGFDGLYVGGAAGGHILLGRQEGSAAGSLITSATTNQFPIDLQGDIFSVDWTSEFFIGFGKRWRRFYSALEVFGQYAPEQARINRQNVNIFEEGGAG